MAASGPVHKSGDIKECANCGTTIIRKVGQNGVNWTQRRFCSVRCSNAAKRAMQPPVDLVGQRFGRWVVTGYVGRPYDRRHIWSCACDCGSLGEVEDSSLKFGKSRSCGCARREASASIGVRSSTHGMSKTAPEYYVWASIKQRCLNPNVRNWHDYGGRGIRICDRWRDSFEAFYEDMGPRPSDRHSIDRIDNDGNYEAGNCRWADISTQSRNRRSNIMVKVNGEHLTLAEAARISAVKYSTVRARLARGCELSEALTP